VIETLLPSVLGTPLPSAVASPIASQAPVICQKPLKKLLCG
jgi:hypothetical protein